MPYRSKLAPSAVMAVSGSRPRRILAALFLACVTLGYGEAGAEDASADAKSWLSNSNVDLRVENPLEQMRECPYENDSAVVLPTDWASLGKSETFSIHSDSDWKEVSQSQSLNFAVEARYSFLSGRASVLEDKFSTSTQSSLTIILTSKVDFDPVVFQHHEFKEDYKTLLKDATGGDNKALKALLSRFGTDRITGGRYGRGLTAVLTYTGMTSEERNALSLAASAEASGIAYDIKLSGSDATLARQAVQHAKLDIQVAEYGMAGLSREGAVRSLFSIGSALNLQAAYAAFKDYAEGEFTASANVTPSIRAYLHTRIINPKLVPDFKDLILTDEFEEYLTAKSELASVMAFKDASNTPPKKLSPDEIKMFDGYILKLKTTMNAIKQFVAGCGAADDWGAAKSKNVIRKPDMPIALQLFIRSHSDYYKAVFDPVVHARLLLDPQFNNTSTSLKTSLKPLELTVCPESDTWIHGEPQRLFPSKAGPVSQETCDVSKQIAMCNITLGSTAVTLRVPSGAMPQFTVVEVFEDAHNVDFKPDPNVAWANQEFKQSFFKHKVNQDPYKCTQDGLQSQWRFNTDAAMTPGTKLSVPNTYSCDWCGLPIGGKSYTLEGDLILVSFEKLTDDKFPDLKTPHPGVKLETKLVR